MSRWYRRGRLYRGRKAHAVRSSFAGPYGETACGRELRWKDHLIPDDTIIDCHACVRAMNKEESLWTSRSTGAGGVTPL